MVSSKDLYYLAPMTNFSKLRAAVLALLGTAAAARGADTGTFIVSPLVGRVDVGAQYPSNGSQQLFKDSGTLYGVQAVYVTPKWVFTVLNHSSDMHKGEESGSLITASRYFRTDSSWQPTAGFSLEHILSHAALPPAEVWPLYSLDVRTDAWAFYPTAGVSYKAGDLRVTPYVGYFREAVGTMVTSDGMFAGPPPGLPGFQVKSSVDLDYASVGVKLEYQFGHILRFDTKTYARFRPGEQTQYTTRNRLDIFLSRRLSLVLKYDRFLDKYESTTLLFAGPAFVF